MVPASSVACKTICSNLLTPSPEGDLRNEERYDAGAHLAASYRKEGSFPVALIK